MRVFTRPPRGVRGGAGRGFGSQSADVQCWLKRSLNSRCAASSSATVPKRRNQSSCSLQGADEALDAPVALGLADEGRARFDAEGLALVLEGAGDELGAMIVAKARALGDADLVVAPAGPDRLAQALDGLESRAPQRGTDAQALAGAVVDEDEDGGVALVGEPAGGVDGPHPVGPVGDDGAVVDLGTADGDGALVGEQPVLAHDAQHPPHRSADASLLPQPSPDVAVASPTRGLAARTPRTSARPDPEAPRQNRQCGRAGGDHGGGGVDEREDPAAQCDGVRASKPRRFRNAILFHLAGYLPVTWVTQSSYHMGDRSWRPRRTSADALEGNLRRVGTSSPGEAGP
jgi:hypothetical protein